MSERIHLWIAKAYRGLNMTDRWWQSHNSMPTEDIEELPQFRGWLHFTDIDTNPSIKNTYSQDAGVDGSRFEYNNLQNTQVKLSFYFEFDDYADYMAKKHDVQAYFAAKATFTIETSYRPTLKADCYVSKADIKPTSDHIAVFDVMLDNPAGMWHSNPTLMMSTKWLPYYNYDLRLPTRLSGVPDWSLHPGHNDIYIAGDQMVQLTNPNMHLNVWLYGTGSSFSVTNHSSNTQLSADLRGQSGGTMMWQNTNLYRITKTNDTNNTFSGDPLNQYSNSTDFWLNPGWNDLELQGASSGYVDTPFYFTTM